MSAVVSHTSVAFRTRHLGGREQKDSAKKNLQYSLTGGGPGRGSTSEGLELPNASSDARWRRRRDLHDDRRSVRLLPSGATDRADRSLDLGHCGCFVGPSARNGIGALRVLCAQSDERSNRRSARLARALSASATLRAVAGGFVAATLAGCASSPDAGYALRARTSQQCIRVVLHAQDAPARPRQESQDVARSLAELYPRRAVEIARIIDVDRLLLELESQHPLRDPVSALQVRQQLVERILLAAIDVQSVLAEIECEQSRGDQLRAGLEGIAARRSQRFALVGILVGASTALVSGAVALARPESDVASIVGILGGSGEGAIGVAGLAEGHGDLLETRRNMLRDIWDGRAETKLFPAPD